MHRAIRPLGPQLVLQLWDHLAVSPPANFSSRYNLEPQEAGLETKQQLGCQHSGLEPALAWGRIRWPHRSFPSPNFCEPLFLGIDDSKAHAYLYLPTLLFLVFIIFRLVTLRRTNTLCKSRDTQRSISEKGRVGRVVVKKERWRWVGNLSSQVHSRCSQSKIWGKYQDVMFSGTMERI